MSRAPRLGDQVGKVAAGAAEVVVEPDGGGEGEDELSWVFAELIKDRVWRTNSQLELAALEYGAWFNTRWLHTSIGNRPPLEIEAEYHALTGSDGSLTLS